MHKCKELQTLTVIQTVLIVQDTNMLTARVEKKNNQKDILSQSNVSKSEAY